MELDELDRKIVAALARDAWLTFVALADIVGLSPSAAQRRVERLIAKGAIKGARAIVAPAALGKPLLLYVLVQLKDESEVVIARFAKRIGAWPDLVEAHYVAGVADIVLVLQTASMERFAAFADEYLNGDAAVSRYKTLTCLRSLH